MYRTLFAVELLHSYFADTKSRGVRIVPTADCARALRRHRMTFRLVGNRAYILAWCDDNSIPLVKPAPETVFRFYLVVEDLTFFQYTALPIEPATNSRLYLSNLSGNEANGRVSLTSEIEAFDAAKSYGPGELVTSGANLFEAMKSIAADPGNSVDDTAAWNNRGALSAISQRDVLEFAKAEKEFEIAAPVSVTTVEVFGLNRVTETFDDLVTSKEFQFDPPTTFVPAPLSKLPAAKYQMRVEGVDHVVYWDPDARPGSCLGIIEIFNHLDGNDPFALFDGVGKAKGPVFSVSFLNPLVIWKYIARTDGVKNVFDKDGVYDFDKSTPLQFRSTTPIPLTEQAYDQIAMEYDPTKTTYTGIQTPSISHLTQIEISGDKLACAEIYLNY